jgi:acetyl-CoA carboxylase biotin carboxylase subunit
VRLDSGISSGWTVPIDYDPMLAKLAVWAGTRDEAIGRMQRAVAEYYVAGIQTNLGFFAELLSDEAFARAELTTGFLDGFFSRRKAAEPDADLEAVAALVAHAVRSAANQENGNHRAAAPSRWLAAGRESLLR